MYSPLTLTSDPFLHCGSVVSAHIHSAAISASGEVAKRARPGVCVRTGETLGLGMPHLREMHVGCIAGAKGGSAIEE